MRFHSALAAPLVLASIFVPSAVHAQPVSTGQFRSALAAARPYSRPIKSTSLRGLHHATAQERRSADDATQIGVNEKLFSPAVVDPKHEGVANNAFADQSRFHNFHSTSYSTLGRTTGFYEYASYSPNADIVQFEYLSSYYGSEAQATNAFNDVTTTFGKASITPTHLDNSVPNANVFTFSQQSNGTTYVFLLDVLQVGRCTAELTTYSTDANFSHNQQVEQAAGSAAGAVAQAAVQVMQAACMGSSNQTGPSATPSPTAAPSPTTTPTPAAQPSITITGVELLHKVKGKVAATKTIKLKESVLFVVLYSVQNANGLKPTATMTIKKGSRKVLGGSMGSDTLSDGTPYFYGGIKFKLQTSVGKLTARIVANVGSASTSRTMKFTLKAK